MSEKRDKIIILHMAGEHQRADWLEADRCPGCGAGAGEPKCFPLANAEQRREFMRSGLCRLCQEHPEHMEIHNA